MPEEYVLAAQKEAVITCSLIKTDEIAYKQEGEEEEKNMMQATSFTVLPLPRVQDFTKKFRGIVVTSALMYKLLLKELDMNANYWIDEGFRMTIHWDTTITGHHYDIMCFAFI